MDNKDFKFTNGDVSTVRADVYLASIGKSVKDYVFIGIYGAGSSELANIARERGIADLISMAPETTIRITDLKPTIAAYNRMDNGVNIEFMYLCEACAIVPKKI